MAIDYATLKNWQIKNSSDRYTARDCMLYAQSLGYGADPLDAGELRFVYEADLKIVPTFFTVIGAPGAWATDPGTGIDWMRILHGEHRLTVHSLPESDGVMNSATRITRIVDKGVGRGALVVTERAITCGATGRLLATIDHTSFCRADGGIGQSDEPAPPLAAAPARAPDASADLATVPSAALLYRLNGDANPIHADPTAARKAGFERPILHGLCTFGMAARAILRLACRNDPSRLASLGLRFSSPFFPGETLRVNLWIDGADVQFEAYALERHVKVLTHGHAMLNPEPHA